MKRLLFFIIPSLIWTACGTPAPQSKSGDSTIEFENKVIQKKVGQCDSPEGACCKIDITYPKAKGGVVSDSINFHMEKAISEALSVEGSQSKTIQQSIESFVKGYESMKSDFPDFGQSWSVDIIGEVAYQGEKLITMLYNDYQYTGGAHPNGSSVYMVFDKKTGKRLHNSDLFTDEAALALEAEKRFRKLAGLSPNDKLSKADYTFDDDKFYINENIGITKDSIVVFYNNYEIAPYAMGSTEIKLALSEVKGALNNAYFSQ